MGRGVALLFGLTCLCQSALAQEQYEYDVDAIAKKVQALTDGQLLEIAVHYGLKNGSLGSYWLNDLHRFDQPIAHLILPYVGSESPYTRERAINALVHYGRKEAPAVLVPIARDKDDPLRLEALRALSRIKCELVLDDLFRMLASEDRKYATFALQVLQEYGTEVTLKAIGLLLDRDQFERVNVDEDSFHWGLSHTAALTLLSLEEEQMTKVLSLWKGSPLHTRRRAAEIVQSRLAPNELRDVAGETEKLRSGNYEDVDTRVFMFLERPEFERHLGPVLKSTNGFNVAITLIESKRDELVELLVSSPEWDGLLSRSGFILLARLAESKSPVATASIVRAAKSDDPLVARYAVRVIYAIDYAIDERSKGWVLEVFRVAEKTYDMDPLSYLLDAFNKYLVGSLSSEVIALTMNSKSLGLRYWLAGAIWQNPDPVVRETVLKLLRDPDRKIAHSAVRAATDALKVVGIEVPPPGSASKLVHRTL